jgi:hypothetical protein
MREDKLQAAVVDAAQATGLWLVYHTFDSRRSAAGFPDLVLVGRPDRRFAGLVVVIELKSARGKTTPAQELWLRAFDANSQVIAWLARPDDLDSVLALLTTGQASA